MRATLVVWLCCSTGGPALAGGLVEATCVEQKVVRERGQGLPALGGEQRICFWGQRIRNEVAFGKQRTVAILDLAARTIALIPGPEPQYVELPLDDYRRLVAMRLAAAGLGDGPAEARLVRTEQTREIRGHACRRWDFELDGELPVRAELWLAPVAGLDFSTWFERMEQLGLLGPLGGLGAAAGRLEGLPIEARVEQRVIGQKLLTTIEVQRVTHEPVAASLFEVPAGHLRLEAGPIPELESPAERQPDTD